MRRLPLRFRSGRWPTSRNSGANGEVFVWLEDRWLSKLGALRGPGESYSDVILRLAAAEYE